MVLIIGGMAQGKLEFAQRALNVTSWSEGVLGEENCVHNLQQAIRTMRSPEEEISAWLSKHPDGVIICDEVGCGVTPLDRADRSWREKTGRVCCELAQKADAVYRVYCGLGARLK